MTQFEKLDLLLRECGGTIQTFQVLNNGISKSVFYAYVKERGLEQASHGVYVSPDTWTDAMFLLHLRCGQAVFSHETALFFHDLTDREPLKYTITVRTGYNPSRLQEDGFQVYTVKKDLHEIGITTMLTSFGHSVPVYDMERTICDLLRSRKNIEMQVFQDALKQYAKCKGRSCIMNRILIIDDDKALCELIKRSVQAENIEADFCNTGKEGLQKLKEQEYQLVVLDVMMPGMDGFETLEEIRKEYSLPILMFTSKNDSISKVRGLRAGADDYLTKPFDMDELIARIASLIRRYTRFNQQAGAIQKLNFNGLQIDLENRSVTTSNGTFELPPKEFDLLLYCAKHQGKILTKQQIYEEVWGEEYFYDDSNIMAIISRLRKKLEVNSSSPKYIQTVKGIGYRFNKEV